MKPTDEERRAVAARLRDFERLRPVFKESNVCAFSDALGIGYMDWEHICACLADLIEPEPERTCHVEYKCRKGVIWPRAVCSVCGHDLSHRDAVDDCGEDEVELCPYCPNCGAKVVEE